MILANKLNVYLTSTVRGEIFCIEKLAYKNQLIGRPFPNLYNVLTCMLISPPLLEEFYDLELNTSLRASLWYLDYSQQLL